MDGREWNALVACLPAPHLLQTWEWGQVKQSFGWQQELFTWHDTQEQVAAAGLLLSRSAGPGGTFKVYYIPRGPLLNWSDGDLRRRVLDELQAAARRPGVIFIKIDPEVRLGVGVPGTAEAQDDADGQAFVDELRQRGWIFSEEQIQFKNTVLVDLAALRKSCWGG